MVSQAKRRARRDAAAEEVVEDDGEGTSSDSDSDGDDAPRKRVKGTTPSSRAAARVGLTVERRTGDAGTSGRHEVKNKEKPLVLSSRGIPSRCDSPLARFLAPCAPRAV